LWSAPGPGVPTPSISYYVIYSSLTLKSKISGREFWGVDRWPLACWDCGFESHRGAWISVFWKCCIAKEIKQYQEKWLQHVQRMDTNRIPKHAVQYQPKGRRNIGRPRKRWTDKLHVED
jgi:hypothetical protein